MSGSIDPAEAPERVERWLSGRPLAERSRQVLDEWLEDRATLARDRERALWVSRAGGRLSARSADRDVRAVAARAGLELSAHTLRHTCLTALVRRGNDLVMVAGLAGHSKLDSTRRWTRPSAADRQAAVEDLRACFALSDTDRRLVFDQRGAENRLGLAVALCAIRFLGFVPHDLASLPEEALAFVAGQVDAAEHELLAYGRRAQTRSDHLTLLLTHLGWRRAPDADHAALGRWLVERAVEHDGPVALMALAGEHLRARRVLRPSVDALARMIATAHAEAHRRVERLVAGQLPAARRAELDALLDGGGEHSELAGLRRRASRTGVRELRIQVDRYRRLLESRRARPAAVADPARVRGDRRAADRARRARDRPRAPARGR